MRGFYISGKIVSEMKLDREIKPSGAAQPVSLAPLKFDDALSSLLKVKPPPKEAKPSKKAMQKKRRPPKKAA